jgi:predicted RNA binding protein YcfA (HicA-like mRNA interferase family)
MSVLPTLSGRDVVRAFARDGWQLARQRGSHMILVKEGHMGTLSVPDHKEVAKGTLRSLTRASGLTVEQFVDLAGKQVLSRGAPSRPWS